MSLPAPTLPRCYRHPDRETGRSCTRCGRPCCSDCLQAVSVGSQCPECLREARPDARTEGALVERSPAGAGHVRPGRDQHAVYLWTLVANQDRIGPFGRGEWDLGLARFFIEQGQYYRLVSSGFLHFGVLHLAMNLLLLFQLGKMLEPVLGRVRFGLIYFASLLAGRPAR